MKIAYRKTHILFNLRELINDKNENYESIDTDNKDYDLAKKEEKIRIIREIVKKIGFTSYTDIKFLTKEQIEKNFKKIEIFFNPINFFSSSIV